MALWVTLKEVQKLHVYVLIVKNHPTKDKRFNDSE